MFLLFAATASLSAQTIAIRAGGIADPSTGTTSGPAVIIVAGDQITAVGPNLPIPAGAEVVDLSGAIVSPGLIDTHTHLAAAYEPGATRLREYTVSVSTAERALQGVANAWQMLESGFTTVRDLGNAGNHADAALAMFFGGGDRRRAAVYGGASLANTRLFGRKVVGPTIVYSGKIVTPYGGQFQLSPEHPDIGRQDYAYADTRDELRRAIRENVHHGATWIKITIDDYPYRYTVDDVRFVVAEAAAAGARVTAHCVTDAGARIAIDGGVASIEHGYVMSDETLALSRDRGIVLVGTESPGVFMQRFGRTEHDSRTIERLRRAHKTGAKLAFGTDIIRAPSDVSRGVVTMSVVDAWVEAGIPARDILRAMTSDAAALLGMERERGLIRPGYYADLIATRVSPLSEIATLKDVTFVMKHGVIMKDPS